MADGFSASSRHFLGAAMLLVLPIVARGSSYYVDSNLGEDARNGTSVSSAWKSLHKVNTTHLAAGDRVLLIRGGVWSGQLDIKGSGTEADRIYIGDYGEISKPKPTINGRGNVTAAVLVENGSDYVTVENLAVTNFDGKDIFDGVEGERSGIQVGAWGGSISHVRILNNDVYYVEGFSNHPTVGPPRGTHLDAKTHSQYTVGAILIHPAQYDDVAIDGNIVHDCTGTGIFPYAFKSSTHLLVQNNTIENVGSDGIEILNSAAPVVQYNRCIHAGNNSGARDRVAGELGHNGLAVCGMWAFASSDVLFQHNYCEGTRQIKYDGEAWDFDNGLSGTCVYQYNFSRDNEGGFLLSNEETRPNYRRIARFC